MSIRRQYTRFFVPLALQNASVSLSYPLVAMVASRGEGGTLNLAGLAQSNTIMFMIYMLGGGLFAAGMVYGKSREGFATYLRVNYLFAAVMTFIQLFLCVPPVSHLLFGTIIGLPPSIENPARTALMASVPLQMLFLIRNPYQALLIAYKATGRSSIGTFVRIALTGLFAVIAVQLDLVGPVWAVACLGLPIVAEIFVVLRFARPYVRNLGPIAGKVPSFTEILRFSLVLSIGSIMLSFSGMVLGAFIARAPEPERILPVYYLGLSLAQPASSAMLAMQGLIIAFPPAGRRDRSALFFGLAASCVVGVVPLLFLLPGLSDFYFVFLQKLPPGDLPLIRVTALLMGLYPLAVGLRALCEGRAAGQKKPMAVLTGHAVFLGTMVSTAFGFLSLGVPGNILGPLSVLTSNLCSAGIITLSLSWEREEEIPVPASQISQGMT